MYFQILISVVISLLSIRWVLEALGAEDYGIFSLMAAIIAMLGFLNIAMATSVQRYFFYYSGANDFTKLKQIFANAVLLHCGIAVIVLVAVELLLPFLFGGFLNIPEARVGAARMLTQFTLLAAILTILAAPFTAVINARENFVLLSVVSLFESLLKLLVAWYILNAEGDRLVLYGICMAGVSLFSFSIYAIWCFARYAECTVHFRRFFSKTLMKEIAGYSGWNLFGALSGLSRLQGVAVLLNLFHGPMINAAYGLANQVLGQSNYLATTLLRVLNPQIMKSEGAGQRKRMLDLSMTASKLCFFCSALIIVPIIFEMSEILRLWLNEPPPYTVIFCCLVLGANLIDQLVVGLQSAVQSVGKIKLYQAVVGGVMLLNIPLVWLLLRTGASPVWAVASFGFVNIVAGVLRIFIVKITAGLSAEQYSQQVVLRSLAPLTASILICWVSISWMPPGLPRILVTVVASGFAAVWTGYKFGLSQDERLLCRSLLSAAGYKISAIWRCAR